LFELNNSVAATATEQLKQVQMILSLICTGNTLIGLMSTCQVNVA